MNEFIQKLIANLLDSLKVGNLKTWAIVALVLGAVQYILMTGGNFGLFELNETWQKLLQGINWIIALLMGARTTAYLNPPQELRSPEDDKALKDRKFNASNYRR